MCLGLSQLCSSINMAETISETVSDGREILPTVRKIVCVKKLFFFVKREMPILLMVKCETAIFFSVKRDHDPPLPPSRAPLDKIKARLNKYSLGKILFRRVLIFFI